MASAFDDHMRCQGMVCVVCYRKGEKRILDKELEYIQKQLIDGFSRDNLDFPSALCNGCHFLLQQQMTG